jgi:hypothetical protein
VDTILSLLSEGEFSSPPLRPAEIGVMAPWREQVWKLRERLRKESLHAIDVGTVEVSRFGLCQFIDFDCLTARNLLGLPRT